MPATITEKFNSREQEWGRTSRVKLRHDIIGEADDTVAKAEYRDFLPHSYEGLPRLSIGLITIGDAHYEGTALYASGGFPVPNEGDVVVSFDTTGGTAHITQSLETVGFLRRNNDTAPAPSHGGAIGVTPDGVEGCDIIVPRYAWEETHILPAAAVTQVYRATLARATGRVNSATFRSFEPGEVLFLGAAGRKRNADEWEITFKFAAEGNRDDIVVGAPPVEISPIEKKGWEYLWVSYLEETDAVTGLIVRRPKYAYVERVYPTVDLNLIGIPPEPV